MAKKETDPVRVRQIQEWLLHGQLVVDICSNIMKVWNITEAQAIQYIADAYEDFSKRANIGHQEAKGYHIQMRISLYKKAMEAKQFKTALQILTDLGKLEDIYPD